MKHNKRLTACAVFLLLGTGANATDIKVNQVGFLPASQKLAVVPTGSAERFTVVDAASGRPVLEGALGAASTWSASGERVRLADLSSLSAPGRYRIRVPGLPDSAPFAIDTDVYRAVDAATLKAYYFNRAGMALLPQHASAYARAAGHPDTQVLVHASAASPGRPEGTAISSPKGWYDAGDYNKYVVNSGISTYTLLAAYEHFPAWFTSLNVDLPESGQGLPDILAEALWNLDWMLSMQDPADGGVYHKLTNKKFDGMVMPDHATMPRYVVQKSTAATLDFAAVMAVASRVLAPFDSQYPGRSARMLAAAENAWQWAQEHPTVKYTQPADIATGGYDDDVLDDEFAWAAAELLISSGKASYRAAAMRVAAPPATVPSWSDVRTLGAMSLAHHRARLAAGDATAAIDRMTSLADRLVAQWQATPYRVTMKNSDFVWGSNAVILNQAMVLIRAYRIAPRAEYLNGAQSALDYVLGRNAVGISFVTGVGASSPMHPHHRPSEADGVAAPVPGWLVGGPNPGQQDRAGCKGVPYPSTLPARSYLDNGCSYASNEVAINWNAPLVYVAGALQALTGTDTR